MKQYFKYLLVCAGMLALQNNAMGQSFPLDTLRVEAFITQQGDTIGQSWLPTVEVFAKQTKIVAQYWRCLYIYTGSRRRKPG